MAAALEIATFGYHEVTDDPTASGFQRPAALPYKLPSAAFQRQLDRIAAGPRAPTLVAEVDWGKPGRYLLLTFDDGGTSALQVSDELCRRGWRGHFFIVTSLIGRRAFLSALEIRELRSHGHTVGSHSHTHPDIFRELSPERMTEEWRVSCARLADILGEPCVTASVPGGDVSTTVFRTAAAAGLRYVFTSEPWLTPRGVAGCHILGRVVAKRGMADDVVERLARFQGWRRELWARRIKVLARRALPLPYRLYVRVRTREWAGAR